MQYGHNFAIINDMDKTFKTIGLLGQLRNEAIKATFDRLINYLQSKSLDIVLEERLTEAFGSLGFPARPRPDIGKEIDLAIVVGGDGSILHAARALVETGTPLIGVNQGRLGFLTDIVPDELENQLDKILAGQYTAEARFLLDAKVDGKSLKHAAALNDIVLASSDPAHMMAFEIAVNGAFMSYERSDGMIIATPTGSSAYALSGGGPIVQPTLDAMVLVPMFSHTLSARPIVIPGDSTITLTISPDIQAPARLNADGQLLAELGANQVIEIYKKEKTITLLHPVDYDYFANVRSKLHWGKKRFG